MQDHVDRAAAEFEFLQPGLDLGLGGLPAVGVGLNQRIVRRDFGDRPGQLADQQPFGFLDEALRPAVLQLTVADASPFASTADRRRGDLQPNGTLLKLAAGQFLQCV